MTERPALHERVWARQHGSNVQHGRKRRRPVSDVDLFWFGIAGVLVAGALVYATIRVFGGGA